MAYIRDPNCIICHLRILSLFWSYGLGLATLECPHHDPVSKPRYSVSKKDICISIILEIIVFIGLLEEVHHFFDNTSELKLLTYKMSKILTAVHIQIIGFSFLTELSFFNRNTLYGFIYLYHKKEDYGVEIGINKRFKYMLKFLQNVIILISGVFMANALYRVVMSNSFYDVITAFMQAFTVVQSVAFASILCFVLIVTQDGYDSFKIELRNLLESKTERHVIQKLRNLHRFYLALTRLVERSFEPVNVIATTVLFSYVVVSLVQVGLYLIFGLRLQLDMEALFMDMFIFSSAILLFLLTVILCIRLSSINRVGDDSISLIYKCSLASFQFSDALQIEMLLMTLLLRRPYIRVGNVITLQCSTLVAVVVNVTTYILVIMQFMFIPIGK